ncbi:MAG: hypothetical protein OEW16_06160 [Gammaproteobacteria bacterium]|nr:hypothetical protein [Gammaproteobacteria bacterium]
MSICKTMDCCERPRDRAWLIEVSALALFLLLVGILVAVPGRQWAEFALGLSAILLGKNAARFWSGLAVRHAGLAVGGGALAAGVAGLVWPESPLLGIFLIATGVVAFALAVREFTTRR